MVAELHRQHSADDRNRTRITSLEGVWRTGVRAAELETLMLLGSRGCPLITLANGPLMARRSWPALGQVAIRPSVFQAGYIPSCHRSCVCSAVSPVAGASRWLLLLLSTLRRPSGGKPTGTLQGMARVRSGQAPPGPCLLTGSVRRGSRIKCDFACTFTSQFPPVLVVLRSQSRLRLEGRTRTLSGPSPDLSPARARLVTRSPPPSQPGPGPAAGGRVRVPGSGPPMSSRNGGYLSVISPA